VAMDSMFRGIAQLLPTPNTMPTSHDEASKLLSKLGLECEVIHMCEKGCILFRGDDLKNATHCPVCKKPRYRDDTIADAIPIKVQICG
jgi:predicted Zn-ribbon and HTH transcriptional regulator